MSEMQFHPLASAFPLLEGEEFDELVDDIKRNGLREKIDLHQGKIADGRNRYRALLQLGIDPGAEPKKYFRKAIYTHTIGGEVAAHEQNNDDRVRAYVVSKNIVRRHLKPEDKRNAIAELLKADPTKSDRQIAKTVKASPTTVGTVRAELEATGDVSKLDTRTDSAGRLQPASKPRPPSPQQVQMHVTVKEREKEPPRQVCVTVREPEKKTPQRVYVTTDVQMSKKLQERTLDLAGTSGAELTALRDFARFTIANINSGDLKISGDPGRYRKWCDLKERAEASLKVPS